MEKMSDGVMTIRLHTVLKIKEGNVLGFWIFSTVWGDSFIITPSEFWPEKVPIYPDLTLFCTA